MRMRRSALAIAMAAGIMVPTVSTAAVAWAGPAAKPVASQKAAKPTKPAKPAKPIKPAKPAKPAKAVKVTFAANGSVTAVGVDAGTVTVAAKGGTKDVKGGTVTVVVPAGARIVVDEAPATLGDIQPGYRISVTGTRLGAVYTAAKVQASAPEPEVTPTPTEPVEEPAA